VNNETTKLFLDLDGVLADCADEYHRLTGGDNSDKGKVRLERLKPFPHFYRHLPLMHDAMTLWNFVAPFHPSILSAQSNFVPASRQDKIEWVAEHFHLTDPTRVIIVEYPNEKYKHCTPGAILIDDSEKNCAEWERAKGIAILHKNAAETIAKLKPILNTAAHVREAFEQLIAEPDCANVLESFDELIDRT
jgi:hypothetical protein